MNPIRILIAHCRYKQVGGEDVVVEAEAELLRSHGHTVMLYERDNHDIDQMPRAYVAAQTVWSIRTSRDIAQILDTFRPEIVHAHNTFPLISPSLYWMVERAGIPLIQTLHNFRLLCPQALHLRNGKICEDCVGKVPWRAVVHKCYRDSALASATIAVMLEFNRGIGSYWRKVTRYIATNEFFAGKFVAGGIPADRISVKPHFVDVEPPEKRERSGGLFVGRLAPEKGIETLMSALRRLPEPAFTVIGDGPERARIDAYSAISCLGWEQPAAVYERMRGASYLVIPSIWYETGPLTLIEGFACGLPVIASRLGALPELIEEGKTGLLFEPGSAEDLAEKIAWAQSHPEEMARMGGNARAQYEARYTPDKNYQRLMEIYSEAIGAVSRDAKYRVASA